MSSNCANATGPVFGFGEAMIRYAPTEAVPLGQEKGGQPDLFLRSIGGDELNVMVALSRLGSDTHWVSVLPDQVLGNTVRRCAESAGVSTQFVKTTGSDSEVGSFTVIPEEKRVHYRRASSAFWAQKKNDLQWDKIVRDMSPSWCHATGITPLCGDGARASWVAHMTACGKHNVPVSIDFNHRPALGTLEELWGIMLPVIKGVKPRLLIFSLKTLRNVAELCGLKDVPPPSYFEMSGGRPTTGASNGAADADGRGKKRLKVQHGTSETDPVWISLMERMFKHLGGETNIACCFKTRDATGLQTRWSVIVDAKGPHTTQPTPTMHVPKDECGGGSAWAAGCIDAYLGGEDDGAAVARRGDLLAALCQETVGDHSWVSRSHLNAALAEFDGKIALLEKPGSSAGAAASNGSTVVENSGVTFRSKLLDPNPLTWLLKRQMLQNVHRMPKLIAIIRAKRPDVAINRAIELVEMGCRAIEITFDTTDFDRVLRTVVRYAGDRALVGVGTAMSAADVRKAASLGAQFALSPINPPGFVAECLRLGLVAVPAAYTPTEVWRAHCEGAHYVKLFPAHMWNPNTLKAMLTTGPLCLVKVMPSGGISPSTARSWFDAGAVGVGMGSALCGKDIKTPQGSEHEETFQKAANDWKSQGKQAAQHALDTLQ